MHLKLKPFFLMLAILAILGGSIYYLVKLPIRSIYITGTEILRDKEIIEAAKVKHYPRMFQYSSRTLKKNIRKLDMVENVKIRKSLLGKLTIEIKEAKVLFYDRSISAYVLSNHKTTNAYSFVGVPFLVNQVPDNIMERLISSFATLDQDAIRLISEIEYSQSKSGDIVIDDTRFLLRMNDGNLVYINLINIDRLDTYLLIYTSLDEKGVLRLDSDNENVWFQSYKSIIENMKKEDSGKDEAGNED